MTDHEPDQALEGRLRVAFDEAADDTGRLPVTAADVIERDRSRTRRRRAVAGAAAGAGLVAASVLIATAGPSGQPGAPRSTPGLEARPTQTPTAPAVIEPGRGSGGSSACIFSIQVGGVAYDGSGTPERQPPLTGRTVPATVPGCNDTGGTGAPDEEIEVAEIEGVSSEVAVFWQDAVLVRRGAELPAGSEAWFEPLTCASDGPTDLVGRWLGVTTRQEVRFDGDLRAPLRITFVIEETTPAADDYVGYTIRIQDEGGAEPALDKEAAEEALWSSRARLRVQVHCEGERFVADGFGLAPR